MHTTNSLRFPYNVADEPSVRQAKSRESTVDIASYWNRTFNCRMRSTFDLLIPTRGCIGIVVIILNPCIINVLGNDPSHLLEVIDMCDG